MIFKRFKPYPGSLQRQILIERLHEAIGTALGEASLCWNEPPQGTLDSKRASKILYKTVASVLTIIDEEDSQIRKNFP